MSDKTAATPFRIFVFHPEWYCDITPAYDVGKSIFITPRGGRKSLIRSLGWWRSRGGCFLHDQELAGGVATEHAPGFAHP